MSFDIFVQCYRDKDSALYPRALLDEIFRRDAIAAATPSHDYTYADGYADIDADEDEIDGFVLSRFAGKTALRRLLEFAAKTNALIIWPSDEVNMAVTGTEVLSHLPDEFTEGGDSIAVVADVEDFIDVAELVTADGDRTA